MANSTRQLVYARVKSLCAFTAGGTVGDHTFETSPKIVDDQADAFVGSGSNSEVAIWVEMGDEENAAESFQLGAAGHKFVLTINVNILVRKRAGTTKTTEANNALQDVRNAINVSPEAWPAACNNASFVGLDGCSTDEGTLSYDDMILFTQPVVFMYAAGPNW